jgi:hypothetical protein
VGLIWSRNTTLVGEVGKEELAAGFFDGWAWKSGWVLGARLLPSEAQLNCGKQGFEPH